MKCPNCNAELGLDDLFCGKCGQPVAVAVEPSLPHVKCAICGAELGPGDRFCGECGAPLVTIPQKETPPPTPPKKSKRGWMALGIAAVIVTALFFAYRLAPEFTSEQPRPATPTLTSQVAEATVATIEWGEVVVTATPEETPDVGLEESTYIQDAWLEHNLLFEGTYYLAVHSSFQVSRSDSSQVWVVARFWFSDGSPMSAQLSDYALQEQAAFWASADVTYEPASYWDDFTLFIPYSALVVGQGHYATVEIRDVAIDEILDWMETESFSINP